MDNENIIEMLMWNIKYLVKQTNTKKWISKSDSIMGKELYSGKNTYIHFCFLKMLLSFLESMVFNKEPNINGIHTHTHMCVCVISAIFL